MDAVNNGGIDPLTRSSLIRFGLVMAAFCLPLIADAERSAPLTWIGGDYSGEYNIRVALAVTARVAGRACQLQLDTGANDAVIFPGDPASLVKPVMVPVELLGISVSVPTSSEVAAKLRQCRQGETVGTLGNAFFEAGSLTLDLKASKRSYSPRPALAGDALGQPMFYARWTPHGGHPLVELRRDGALKGYVLLDTGSAASGFTPWSRAQWDAVTASAQLTDTNAVHEFEVPSWGRTLKCYATRASAPLQAGSWPLRTLLVTYCPELAFNPPVKVEGLVGLRGFGEAVITIDYLSGRWLVAQPRRER